MSNEYILLCGNRSEEEIKRIVAYLVETFPMARDAKLTARPVTEQDPDYLQSAGWLGVFPDSADYWKRFSSTIDKMRSAANDYERGWADAMKHLAAQPSDQPKTKRKKAVK